MAIPGIIVVHLNKSPPRRCTQIATTFMVLVGVEAYVICRWALARRGRRRRFIERGDGVIHGSSVPWGSV